MSASTQRRVAAALSEEERRIAADAAAAAKWGVEELSEEGWVPCVMSPALHHATYTNTNVAAVAAKDGDASSSEASSGAVGEATAAAFVVVGDKKNEKKSGKAEEAKAPTASDDGHHQQQQQRVTRVDAPLVTFTDTDVSTPNGKLLIDSLSMTWAQGQSWAISGPNGCGKSSLLRVIARTWLPSRGTVGIHSRVRFIYVPQTPYFPPDSTLCEQVMYPDVPSLVRFVVTDEVRPRDSLPEGSAAIVSASHVVGGGSVSSVANGSGVAAPKRSSNVIIRRAVAADDSNASPDKNKKQSESEEKEKAPLTAMSAPEEVRDLMVCPKEQRRMKEALLLATGRQLLAEVIHGWDSPTAGLYNPHRKFVRSRRGGGSAASAAVGSDGAAAALASASAHQQAAADEVSDSEDLPTPSSSDASPTDSTSTHQHHSNNGSQQHFHTHTHANTSALTHSGPFSGCERTLAWPSLSGGQQQKLSLSRAFYHSLKAIEEGFVPIVVLDESTSQMDEASEDAVFKNLSALGIDMLSVSHRKEVVLRHTHILQLARNPSAWRIVEVDANTVHEALDI